MSAYTKKKRITTKPSAKPVLVKKKGLKIPTKKKRKKENKDASKADVAKLS